LLAVARDEIADSGALRLHIVNCAAAVGPSHDVRSSWKRRLSKQM
jgi:hypothetical protein